MARQDKPYKGTRNEIPDTLNLAEGARVMLTRNKLVFSMQLETGA